MNEKPIVLTDTEFGFRPLAGKWVNELAKVQQMQTDFNGFRPLAGKWVNEL